jgi:hypothetical protein
VGLVEAFKRMRNSRKQGDAGLGIAISWFACAGWTVSIPLTDSQPYDLVVDDSSALKKVSVKSTTEISSKGMYKVDLRTRGGNKSQTRVKFFDPTEIDLLFVACSNGENYLIPVCEIIARSYLELGSKYENFMVC